MANLMFKNELYNTKDLESVFGQCTKTQKYRLMTGLIADTGMGKTTSLQAYEKAAPNVFRVTVDKTMNAKGFFLKIGSLLNIGFDGNIHQVMLRISKALNALESPLLIVDEAGKLNHVMMLYLHDLREYTKDNCGILLAGMPYFKSRLIKFSENQKEGCSEFLRRINVWHELKGLNRKEIEYICKTEEVENDYKGYYGLRFGDLMNKILLEKITTNKI